MIVFWSTNDQRKKRFLAVDVIHRYVGFALLDTKPTAITVTLFHGRKRYVKAGTIFDDATTPPTLLGTSMSLNYVAQKHPDFPKFYINGPGGDICSLSGGFAHKAGMDGPKTEIVP